MGLRFTPNTTSGGSLRFTTNQPGLMSSVYTINWGNVASVPTLVSNLGSLDATAGLLAQVSATSWEKRTLTAPAAGISVSNGNGVSGNPTLALANDLAALEGLSSTGIAVRTASDTWAQRTITGTANEITLSNGDGVSGNPTVSLPSALTFTGKTVTGGQFNSIKTESFTVTASGTDRMAISGGSENVVAFVGQGNSKTASIHLNPGSGTLPTGTSTIAEFVLQRTADQAFGGNYGRWSLTTFASGLSNASGLYGEYGGTEVPGPFIFNLGIENPASSFASYEFMRFNCQTSSAVNSIIGSVSFGNGQTTPQNQIVLNMSSIGSAGNRDSHAVLWEGKANDGTERAVWWKQFVDVTSNAGASVFTWAKALNTSTFNTRMTLGDDGILKIFGGDIANAPATDTGVFLHIMGANAGTARMQADGFGAAPGFLARRANNTAASPSALSSGNTLFAFECYGYGSTGYSAAARAAITLETSQAWTDANQGTRILFSVTDNSTTTTATRATLNYGNFNLASGVTYNIAGTQVVGPRDTGWTAMTGTPNENTSYDTASVTLPQLAGRVMALQTALTTHGLIGA